MRLVGRGGSGISCSNKLSEEEKGEVRKQAAGIKRSLIEKIEEIEETA